MSDEGYEMHYIREAFDTNWIAPLGPNVDAFEQEFAHRIGASHAAALSSGTAAIHMSLLAAGIGAGDIVLCQSLTFSASANPIIYAGATPVFIDSDAKTWNMDPEALEIALEKYKGRVKAVIVVHLYGLAADMDAIVDLCKVHRVTLIEDAAESLGTTYKGKPTGTFGDYGIFSFNGNKIITTSGGGMLVSDDEERIAKVRFWATQARDPARHYQHSELGFNYRMSNIAAGIGRGQLKVLDERVAKKNTFVVSCSAPGQTNRVLLWGIQMQVLNSSRPINVRWVMSTACCMRTNGGIFSANDRCNRRFPWYHDKRIQNKYEVHA